MYYSVLKVSIHKQRLYCYEDGKMVNEYVISTAKNGPGERYGSEQTPRGKHIIRAKIGKDLPINTVFIRRRPTGEIFSPELKQKEPNRTWVLTRILWLCGQEPGKNRFGNVDTMQRKIYIHGSPLEDKLGSPQTHGCVTLNNNDMIELFDRVSVGSSVLIEE